MQAQTQAQEKSAIQLMFHKPSDKQNVFAFDRYATRGEIEKQVIQVLKEVATNEFDGDYNLSSYDIAESCSLYFPYNREEPANLHTLIVAPSKGTCEGEIIRLIGCDKNGELIELMSVKFITNNMDFVWTAARAIADAIQEGSFI